MSEEREPLRLRDDPSEAPGLRAMLEAAQAEAPDPAMLDRVLGNVLGGGGGGAGGGGAAAAAKIAAAATAVVGAGAIAWMMSGASVEPPTPVPRPSSIVIVDAAIETDAFVEADAGPTADVGVDAFVVARVDRRAPPPVTDMETDGVLLMRAAREHDPAAQLALAREHGARFPNSPSAEDRESMIVLDLAALGRRAEATAAADAFRTRWPRSPDLPHIEAALARMTRNPAIE